MKKKHETLQRKAIVELKLARAVKEKEELLMDLKLQSARLEVEERTVKVETAKIEKGIAEEKLRLLKESGGTNNHVG